MSIQDRRRNIGRINEIVKVLAKYGFETFAHYITSKNTRSSEDDDLSESFSSDTYVRIRMVLQELGTTFIKLGQTLSTYPELVGFELAKELSKLQEAAPITDYDTVKGIIETEFSKPVDEIFEEFSPEPIASASIGQVHTAFLNNVFVAVKVQHPDIEETIESDINIMKIIAKRLDNNLSTVKPYNLPGLVEVFEKDIKKQLDYNFEAMNAFHISDLLKNDDVYIPKVYKKYSTSKVLVMEYLDGVSLGTVINSKDKRYNKRELARKGADSFIKQLLIHGFYHADPHPGNIFVLNYDTLAFVDFGMMGHIDSDLREDLAKLFIFVADGNAKLLTKQLMYMGIVGDYDNFKKVEYEIMLLLDKYYGEQFNDISGVLKGLIEDEVLKEYDIVLPRDLMMVIRTISMIDEVGKDLDPTFEATKIVKPYAMEMLVDNVKPKRLFNKATESVMDIQHLVNKLPNSLLNFFSVVDDGRLKIYVDLSELDAVDVIISRLVNELVLTIIIAAMLVGSSLIMLTDNGFKIMGYPFLGFLGFTVSAFLGIILIILIITRGNY